MITEDLKVLRQRLKSGEYDGADIMAAWLAIDRLIAVQPAPNAEPVALRHVAVSEDGILRWMTGIKPINAEMYAMSDGGRAPKLYVAPITQPTAPARQPLTDAEILQRYHGESFELSRRGMIAFARAIEAAHGIGATSTEKK